MAGENSRLEGIKAVLSDVDGTLLDDKNGYCKSVNGALEFYGFDKISGKKIISLRRSGVRALDILKVSVGNDKRLRLVDKLRSSLRESRENRKLDRPFKNVKRTLLKFKKMGKKIYIVSLRESGVLLDKQLREFGLMGYFDDIFVIKEKLYGKDHGLMKNLIIARLLKKYGYRPEECVIIGDTSADIRGGKRAGIHTIAVTTGMEGRKALEMEGPEFLVSKLSEAEKIII